jgi:Na+-transporting methylmalonyl-CoA/oxaloacetate decarboxylase gamma subunit
MGDVALVFSFLCMLMVPCYLAARTVRSRKDAQVASESVFAVAESDEDGEDFVVSRESVVDRRALAIQRSREIYFRTSAAPQKADYGRLEDRSGALE